MIEAGKVRKTVSAAHDEGTSVSKMVEWARHCSPVPRNSPNRPSGSSKRSATNRGAMSALISMAYAHVTDPTAHGMAGRIQHVRAILNSRKGQVTDSQRLTENALMLYSIHAYARLHIQPDLALERGKEAFAAARGLGDRWLEALAAGGMSLTYASIGAYDESSAWLERAASAAMSVPSTSMARRLEMWRGSCEASRGRADEMIAHYVKAAELAGTKNPAGAVEALCALAVGLAKLSAETGDPELLERAGPAAQRALDSTSSLPAGTPWATATHAVLALTAQAQGLSDEAASEARAALTSFDGITHMPYFIDVLWVAARVLVKQQAPEAQALVEQIAQGLGYLSMSMTNPETKTMWFSMHSHRELAEIVGLDLSTGLDDETGPLELEESDVELLRLITSGSGDDSVGEAVSKLLAKLGVASQTEAIEYTIKAGVTWQ